MRPVRGDLPAGTVTFLFTDVEGSTKLLHELGAEGYAQALAEHRRVLRDAFTRHGGVEVDTQGDAFFVAFPTAPGALQAAQEALEGLSPGPIRVRVGIHTGTPHLAEEGYVGADVHRAARIAAAAHGGQVLVSAATARLLEANSTVLLADLGEHRLKDFDERVSLHQLGEERFPPLKTISNTNLPRPASSFVGREKEVAQVATLLQGGARLLTLTGPGGSGKTRLAIEAATELVPEFKAGVFWVGLAALRDPALVSEEIAQTLGTKDGLTEHIGERELLLLLDNLEQVVAAAPELAALVEACPNLRLLVTSRELLHVRGEVEYPVLPLAEPDAVELFCARARSEPDDTVHALCRALDNLPLALELAAARASVLSPRQILERLSGRLDLFKGGRDADPRQQTLRATIEWSHELLAPEEQRLFAHLAVFRGGCTLDAAEDVVHADLDTLQSLVDKSLLRRSDERYWMLETIREYAAERLEASGEADELRQRHADHYVTLARELEPHAAVSKEWLDRLEREHDNVRAALDRLPTQGGTQLALELAAAVWRFWKTRGHQPEAERRLAGLLAADETPTAARAHALNAAAGMAVETGNYAAGRQQAEEALALHREYGDAWGIARATYMLGYAAIESGDFETAKPRFEETVRLMGELGYEEYVGLATFNLSWACEELGEREYAQSLAEENLRRARSINSTNLEAASLDSLAGFAHDDGRFEEALLMKRAALRLLRELGDVQHVLDSLGRIANTHAHAARSRLAAELLSASLALHEEAGLTVPLYQERRNHEMLELLHEHLDEAEFAEAWEHGRALTLDEAVALALES
jgi:predicted ATPase/class 3 adenylate cyclase